MRKFTKTHNDLEWLFPTVDGVDHKTPEELFDFYEKIGTELLEMGYSNKETFTKDDMIDAFMKGASVSRQFLGCDVERKRHSNIVLEDDLSKMRESLDLLMKSLTENKSSQLIEEKVIFKILQIYTSSGAECPCVGSHDFNLYELDKDCTNAIDTTIEYIKKHWNNENTN